MSTERIRFTEAPAGMYEAMMNVEKYLKQSGLSPELVELIKVRVSQINGCGYCLDMHHKIAVQAGEKLERLYLLPAWEESPCYTEKEKATLHFVGILTDISNQKESVEQGYAKMETFFSRDEIANIILAICQINSWNRISIAFGSVPGSYVHVG